MKLATACFGIQRLVSPNQLQRRGHLWERISDYVKQFKGGYGEEWNRSSEQNSSHTMETIKSSTFRIDKEATISMDLSHSKTRYSNGEDDGQW